QTNPAQAQSLQRELAGALGGETIPMRRALLVGEEVLKQNANSRSLLEKAPYDFEQMRKSYWQSMETYKAEFAQKNQEALQKEKEPVQKEEPRPSNENTASLPFERASDATPAPVRQDNVPKLSPEHQATRETLEKVRDRGKMAGWNHSADLLDHYLKGCGEPVNLDKDWVRQHPPVKEGEAKSQKHFEEWLVGQGPKDNSFGKIWDHLPKGDGAVTIKGMYWDGAGDSSSWQELGDKGNSLGGLSVRGMGDLKLERKGNEVIVTGTINQYAEDKYDFEKNNKNHEWLPQGALGGDFTMTRQQITDMEKVGGAKAFKITTDSWTKDLEGRLKLDDSGNIIGSQFEWKEVPASDKVRR
ncbi:MAG: hypothetical protein HQL43_07070, partial [Alphaproteobacteria bacterium]|nr:hypothetical protein [Alphaproteobacteria bacterium]